MKAAESINRRSFIKTSGMALTAASLGIAFPREMHASALPGHFNMSQTSIRFMNEVQLSFRSAWQSFGFDTQSTPHRIFYVQQCNLRSGATGGSVGVADSQGDLRLSYVAFNGADADGVDVTPVSATSDYMYLYGFGHGGSIGVEPGTTTHIWLECNGMCTCPAAVAAGDQICRIPFVTGVSGTTTFTYDDIGTSALPGSAVFTLKPGSTQNSVNVDTAAGRLMLRFSWPGGSYTNSAGVTTSYVAGTYFSLYNLSTVLTGVKNPAALYDFISASAVLGTSEPNFQGMASYGDYGYVLAGAQKRGTLDGSGNYTEGCDSTIPADATTHFTEFSFADLSGTTVTVEAGAALYFREPEGVCIWNVNDAGSADNGKPRLCYGIKSGVPDSNFSTCTDTDDNLQQVNIYYKDQLLT